MFYAHNILTAGMAQLEARLISEQFLSSGFNCRLGRSLNDKFNIDSGSWY